GNVAHAMPVRGTASHTVINSGGVEAVFFFSSRRRHTRSVSAFLLNRSSDLGHVFCKLFNWRRLRTRRPKLGSTLPVGSVRIKCTAWKCRRPLAVRYSGTQKY